MELTFSKTNKPVSSQKEEWRLQRFLLPPKKHYHPTLWVWWKREDAKSSWKPCKTLRKKTPRPTKKLKSINQPRLCSKSLVCKKIPLISLVMPLPCTLMRSSWTSQQSTWSEKFNCIWTLWEDMEILLSFIQFMDWEVFQKASQESVLLTVELLC